MGSVWACFGDCAGFYRWLRQGSAAIFLGALLCVFPVRVWAVGIEMLADIPSPEHDSIGRSHCVGPFERVLIFQHYTIPNSIFSADDFGHARSGNKNLNGFNGSVPMIRGDNEADRGRVSVLRNWVQFGADGNHVYKRFEQSWASAIVHSPYGYGQLNLSIII